MNENNMDLTKILKDCPKGWKFYSSMYGDVEFVEILPDVPVTCRSDEYGWCLPEVIKRKYPIKIKDNSNIYTLSSAGRYRYGIGECILFPSKDQRDWNKFTAPWYKKDKFDPKSIAAV